MGGGSCRGNPGSRRTSSTALPCSISIFIRHTRCLAAWCQVWKCFRIPRRLQLRLFLPELSWRLLLSLLLSLLSLLVLLLSSLVLLLCTLIESCRVMTTFPSGQCCHLPTTLPCRFRFLLPASELPPPPPPSHSPPHPARMFKRISLLLEGTVEGAEGRIAQSKLFNKKCAGIFSTSTSTP